MPNDLLYDVPIMPNDMRNDIRFMPIVPNMPNHKSLSISIKFDIVFYRLPRSASLVANTMGVIPVRILFSFLFVEKT